MKKQKNLFVLDTNVPMHDWQSVYKFQEHDICIPFIVVQELDKHKTTTHLSYNVRHALKFLDKFNGSVLSEDNLIGEGLGKIFISIPSDKNVLSRVESINIENNDDEIVHNVLYLKEKYHNKYNNIVLVTKDAGMRVKASSLGIEAQDYLHDSVQVDMLYKGIEELDVNSSVINTLYQGKNYIEKDDIPHDLKLQYNQCVILQANNASQSALACFQKDKHDQVIDDTLTLVTKRSKKEKSIAIETRNAEQAFLYHILSNRDISLVTVNGIAGTGKTLLSLLVGLEQTLLDRYYNKFLAMRPIMGLSGKEIGFLPGDEKAKIDPYMRPIYDNLDFIKSRSSKKSLQEKMKLAIEENDISIEAMTYVRGRTYNNTFVLIDEAQNLTPHEAKTLITRIGEGSKIVLAGDVLQTDAPYLNETSNGLAHVIDRFSKENFSFYGHITLEKGERSDLASIAAKIL